MTKRGDATERSVATGTAEFTILTGSGQASLPVLATWNEEGIVAGRRAQEDDAALDSEDVLTQAEEAHALWTPWVERTRDRRVLLMRKESLWRRF